MLCTWAAVVAFRGSILPVASESRKEVDGGVGLFSNFISRHPDHKRHLALVASTPMLN